jgi:hypothetical protein
MPPGSKQIETQFAAITDKLAGCYYNTPTGRQLGAAGLNWFQPCNNDVLATIMRGVTKVISWPAGLAGAKSPHMRSSTEAFCVVLPFAPGRLLRNLIEVLFTVFSFSLPLTIGLSEKTGKKLQ